MTLAEKLKEKTMAQIPNKDLYAKLEEMGFKYKCEKYEIHKRLNILQVETKIMW